MYYVLKSEVVLVQTSDFCAKYCFKQSCTRIHKSEIKLPKYYSKLIHFKASKQPPHLQECTQHVCVNQHCELTTGTAELSVS